MGADLISGIVQTGIFCARNGSKVATGKDTGRIGATAAQAASMTDKVAASESSIFGGKIAETASAITEFADKGILKAAEKLGKTEAAQGLVKSAGTNSIFGAVAQKAVNPLLIGAASIRVLSDEDQYAALLEEGCAMSLMFSTEKLMTKSKKAFFKAAEEGVETLSKSTEPGILNSIKNTAKEYIGKAAKSYGGLSKNNKTIANIGIGLLFVAGSICAYSIGKTIGTKLSGRDEK